VTQKVVALVSLSGVGKTSALVTLTAKRPFQHLSASRLIREGRELSALSTTADTLHNANIDENQRLLIAGFKRAIDLAASFVVLDGHTVVETPSGLVPIGADVFGALAITDMIFLSAAPSEILQRRALDISRNRPPADMEQIEIYQERAMLEAFRVCCHLKIPLSVINGPSSSNLEKLIFG
jgi:adenylate kinase